jgi:hypothetical protein
MEASTLETGCTAMILCARLNSHPNTDVLLSAQFGN